ncbi:MAG: ABC transporter permease, partial [Clostridia bacterium]
MAKYFVKRILYVIMVFVIMSVLMFFIYKAVPGDPVRLMLDSKAQSLKPAQYQKLYDETKEKMG